MAVFDLDQYDLSALLMRAHRNRVSGVLCVVRGQRRGSLWLRRGVVTATAGLPLGRLLDGEPGRLEVRRVRAKRRWDGALRRPVLRRPVPPVPRRHPPSPARIWRVLPQPTPLAAHLFAQARGAAPPRVWPDHMRVTDPAGLAALKLDLSAREHDLLAGTLRPSELPPGDLGLLAALWRLGAVGAVRPQALRTRVGWRPWGRTMLVQQSWVDAWAEQLGCAPTELRVSSRQRTCQWPVQAHPGTGQPRVPLLWLLQARVSAGSIVTLLPPGLAEGGNVPGATVIESHPTPVR